MLKPYRSKLKTAYFIHPIDNEFFFILDLRDLITPYKSMALNKYSAWGACITNTLNYQTYLLKIDSDYILVEEYKKKWEKANA